MILRLLWRVNAVVGSSRSKDRKPRRRRSVGQSYSADRVRHTKQKWGHVQSALHKLIKRAGMARYSGRTEKMHRFLAKESAGSSLWPISFALLTSGLLILVTAAFRKAHTVGSSRLPVAVMRKPRACDPGVPRYWATGPFLRRPLQAGISGLPACASLSCVQG